jgi:hypothetical protein
LADAIDMVVEEWNIKDKITCITTDGASNNSVMCKNLDVTQLKCVAHIIHLAVEDSMAEPMIAGMYISYN